MDKFTDAQIKKINEAGFTLNAAGKVTQNGRMVKADVVTGILDGAIVANVDFAELKKQAARTAASGGDLISALNKISPHIANLGVGQTARIPMPKGPLKDDAGNVITGTDGKPKDPKRSFVMSVVTKLNNVTLAGREWAGRQFDTMSSPEGDFLYVARLPDGEAKTRKAGGGRKSKNALAAALEKTAEALGENKGETEAKLGDDAEKIEEQAEAQAQGEAQEEAIVVTH